MLFSDSELIKAVMASNIVRTYSFKIEMTGWGGAMAVDFVAHLERGLGNQKPRGNSHCICGQLISGCDMSLMKVAPDGGIPDTYDHTRGIPGPGKNGGKRGRSDPYRTFPRNNRYNPRGDNWAIGEEVGYEEDNGIVAMEIVIILVINGVAR